MQNIEKKSNSISMRISNRQLQMLDDVKADDPRLGTTDMLMSGINLLDYLLKTCGDNKGDYKELINALLIRDDLLRCLDKPDNPQIDNVRVRSQLCDSKEANEKNIKSFLKALLKSMNAGGK